jgi:hypothetical protein
VHVVQVLEVPLRVLVQQASAAYAPQSCVAQPQCSRSFVEFVVLDVAPEATCNGKVQPALMRAQRHLQCLEPNFLIKMEFVA